MSYEHLAGRLIETQRSMLGKPAVDIARSIGGLTVAENGNVTAVDGDGREVVDNLARQYTDMLGDAAETRLMTAAREFEDELVLPPSLGGPEEVEPESPGPTAPGPPAGDPAAGRDVRTETVSDGGTVDVQPPGTPAGPSAPGPGEGDDAASNVPVPEPVTFEYTVASTVDADDDTGDDLASVYLLPTDGEGWQAPVTVENAVVGAVAEATSLNRDELDDVTDHLDSERLLATLNDEDGETVSFAVRGFTLTFHRSGSLAVH